MFRHWIRNVEARVEVLVDDSRDGLECGRLLDVREQLHHLGHVFLVVRIARVLRVLPVVDQIAEELTVQLAHFGAGVGGVIHELHEVEGRLE